jgi:hypothetical protein
MSFSAVDAGAEARSLGHGEIRVAAPAQLGSARAPSPAESLVSVDSGNHAGCSVSMVIR